MAPVKKSPEAALLATPKPLKTCLPYSLAVTITVYVLEEPPFVTTTFTVFSPSSHVTLDPLVTELPFTEITTPAFSSVAVAVTVFDALLVVVS